MIYEGSGDTERVNVKVEKYTWLTRFVQNIFKSNVIWYIVVLALVSMVSMLGVYPMASVMLAVAALFNIPTVVGIVVTCAVYLIFKIPVEFFLLYGVFAVFFVVINALFVQSRTSSKVKTIVIYFISMLLASLLCLIFFGYTSENITMAVVNTLLGVTLFPVISSGMIVAFNLRKPIIFSKTEVISFCVVVALVLSLISQVNIYNFNIATVLLLIAITIIGWQSDWANGALTGAIVGIVYAIIAKETSLVIIACTFSGLIAGAMNRFSKWSLAIVFSIGNIAIAYIYKSNIQIVYQIAQILVASMSIIALPKKWILKIESLVSDSIVLNKGYENQLDAAVELKSRTSAIGEVLKSVADVTLTSNSETIEETKLVILNYLNECMQNDCIKCKNKKACAERTAKVAENIAKKLEKGDYLIDNVLPFKCASSEGMISEILNIYGNIKLMRVVKQKEKENNMNIAKQYQTLSSVLKEISLEDSEGLKKTLVPLHKHIREELTYNGYVIYEDSFTKNGNVLVYEYITDILTDIDKAKNEIQKIVSVGAKTPMTIKLILNSSKTERSRIKLVTVSKFNVDIVAKQMDRADSTLNGDSYKIFEDGTSNKVILLSDGEGTGVKAKNTSKFVIDSVEKLLKANVKMSSTSDFMQGVLGQFTQNTTQATLDITYINESESILAITKINGAVSYVIKDKQVELVNINGLNGETYKTSLSPNMFVVTMSDGAMPYVSQDMFKELIEEQENIDAQMLLNKICSNIGGIMLDDVTVIVAHII